MDAQQCILTRRSVRKFADRPVGREVLEQVVALAAYAPIGAGVPGRQLDRVIGVLKAYSTCVGEGPFVCEWSGPEAEALREAGAEVLGAVSIYYVLGWPRLKQELETGRPKPIGRAFGFVGRFIYVPLTALVVILGFVYGGIG